MNQNPHKLTPPLLLQVMQNELDHIVLYQQLWKMTSNKQDQALIQCILDDGKKHLSQFEKLYEELTGCYKRLPQPKVPDIESFNQGILASILCKVESYEMYRNIYIACEKQKIRNIFFKAMTDQNKHALTLNYMYTKILSQEIAQCRKQEKVHTYHENKRSSLHEDKVNLLQQSKGENFHLHHKHDAPVNPHEMHDKLSKHCLVPNDHPSKSESVSDKQKLHDIAAPGKQHEQDLKDFVQKEHREKKLHDIAAPGKQHEQDLKDFVQKEQKEKKLHDIAAPKKQHVQDSEALIKKEQKAHKQMTALEQKNKQQEWFKSVMEDTSHLKNKLHK